MNTRTSILSFIFPLLLSGALSADTITKKDGTAIEGKILKETETAYLVKVETQKGIFSEVTVNKVDIAPEGVVKTTAADYAFAEISGLVPSKDRLTADNYREMIDGQVKPFIVAFPDSKHLPTANEMLKTLEEEYKKATAGGLKLDDKWITPEDRLADAYELDARMSYDDFNTAAQAEKFVRAFREFEYFEKSFAGSGHYEKSIEFAKSLLKIYQTNVLADLAQVDAVIKKRALQLTFLEPNDRNTAEDKIARVESSYQRLLTRERASGTKWLTLEKYHKDPMEDTLRAIDSMTRRLEVLNLSKIEAIDPVYKQALAAVSAGNVDKAKEFFAQLEKLGLPESYIITLQGKLPAEDPQPDPDIPTTNTNGGTNTPDPDPTTVTPDDPEKPNTDGPEDVEEAVDRAPVAEEGGLNVTAILMVVMGLVLVIAVFAVFAGGKSKK